MYRAVTRKIEVTVTPRFVSERSSPTNGYYFWAYTIDIANLGSETVQLKTRHWRITDAHGRLQEVRGPGVVGEEPVLKPGESFEYISGVPLPTPSGFMAGSYGMVTAAGEHFDIEIPAFSLDFILRRAYDQLTASTRLHLDLAGREHVIGAAEFAGDGNLAVLDHVVAVVLRKAFQHGFHAGA